MLLISFQTLTAVFDTNFKETAMRAQYQTLKIGFSFHPIRLCHYEFNTCKEIEEGFSFIIIQQ